MASEKSKILVTCRSCKKKNPEGAKFCESCGKDLRRGVKPESQSPSKKKTICEIKCICNQCGKVWHYLKSDERGLKMQACGNLLVGGGMCCNPFGSLFLNKSIEASREANKFNKCPN